MIKKVIFVFSFFSILLLNIKSIEAQNKIQKGNVVEIKAQYHDVSKPLTEMKPVKNWNTGNKKEPREIINFFRRKPSPLKVKFVDPIIQKDYRDSSNAIIEKNFKGAKNSDNSSYVAPPDTQGDVSDKYYVQTVNNVTVIFDKAGHKIWGPSPTSTFWDGFSGDWTGTNDGDAIVLYDQNADRWLISQFAVNTNSGNQYELIAISTTNDPTGSYNRYAFQFPLMPDYPKIGVWNDAYYMGANGFDDNGNFKYSLLVALQRDSMLTGQTAKMQYFTMDAQSIDQNVYTPLPFDCDGQFPANGTPGYFVYDQDDDTYWNKDAVDILAMNVDWQNSDNSTLSETEISSISAFNSNFSTDAPIAQAGTDHTLDALNDRMMFRAQFRKFSDHNSMVVCRTVNSASNDIAGVRWYEFRQPTDGGTWSLYQEGTYAPDDGNSRWLGSIAMNSKGDIALGYSLSGASAYPSIMVAGRHNGDPLGQMTISETEIYRGSASQTASSDDGPVTRWGDYSMMSVDPVSDDFWYTTEYSAGDWNWETQIANFSLPYSYIPYIVKQPENIINAKLGSDVFFYVGAVGSDLHYQWYHNDKEIDTAESDSLLINNVSADYVGTYFCNVYNDSASVYSDTVSLKIIDPIIMKMYPNPAAGDFYLLFEKMKEPYNLRIISPTGYVIYSKELTQSTNHIVLSSYMPGIYFIEITSSSNEAFEKIFLK